MVIWVVVFLFLFFGGKSVFAGVGLGGLSVIRKEDRKLQAVVSLLHELQETLETGLVPSTDRWEKLQELPQPWGELAYESLQGLRSRGAALIPTLNRLRGLALEHQASLKDARAKAAQGMAQALICAVLVPFFGLLLALLLPGVKEHPTSWLMACGVAFLLSFCGILWLLALSENARWGGLRNEERPWILSSQCAIERFLAMIHAGTPPDLAWTQACDILARDSSLLASWWGHSIWGEPLKKSSPPVGTAGAIIQAGAALRRAVQVSLMEGRPCAGHVETVIQSLRQDIRANVERELTLLGTRALKPLFLCVAPALMGLLFFGLFLSWDQTMGV